MGRRNRRNRIDATGRSPTSRFARLDHAMLNSNAYRALSPNARSLLVELTMLDNGSNNGSLYLSVRDAAHRLGVADLTAASRAFDDLAALGFIEMTKDAHFKVKAADTSRARCWRLSWLPGPGRKPPTSDFMAREPEPKTQARKRMERGLRALKAYRKARDSNQLPVVDSDTVIAIRPESVPQSVSNSDMPKCEIGGFAPKSIIPDSDTYTAAPWGRGAAAVPLGWWQPDWSTPVALLAFVATVADNRWSKAA